MVDKPQWEKMSKSRGNVVLPEEVVYGVYELNRRYEFRRASGEVLDFKKVGVWRDKGNTGFFYTSTRDGRKPVYLCEVGISGPCLLTINGEEKEQHPGYEEVEYIAYMKEN